MLHVMDLEIRARLASDEQVMLVDDIDCSEPIRICRPAAPMAFRDGLIVRNDLFFDPRPF